MRGKASDTFPQLHGGRLTVKQSAALCIGRHGKDRLGPLHPQLDSRRELATLPLPPASVGRLSECAGLTRIKDNRLLFSG